MKSNKFYTLALAALAVLMPAPSKAIPAWARKYGVECFHCHVGGLKLNATGRKFLRAGHQILDASDASKETEERSGLGDYASLAMDSKVYVKRVYKSGNTPANENEDSSSIEQGLSLHSGGPLDNGFSFFSEMEFNEISDETSGRPELGETYLQYTTGDDKVFTSVRAGQLGASLLRLNGTGPQTPQDRPLVVGMRVGDNPYSPIARQYGVAVSQEYHGLFVEAAVVNGTGSEPANRIDNNWAKDLFATLDYSLDSEKSSVQLGGYYYKGSYPLSVDLPDQYSSDDDFYQLGVILNCTTEMGHVIGAVYTGENNYRKVPLADPGMDRFTTSRRSLGGFWELAVYLLDAKLNPYVRYDFTDTDQYVPTDETQGIQVGLDFHPYEHGRVTIQGGQKEVRNALQASYSVATDVVLEAIYAY